MDIGTQRIRALLDKRDAIDAELANALIGKKIKCGNCGEEGHTTRTCANKPTQSSI